MPYEMQNSASGYNANIGENMYIEELKCFIDSVESRKPFVNTLANDHQVLKLLYAIEDADTTSAKVFL